MSTTLQLDTGTPVVVFKAGRNVIQHGTLGIVRSLGRMGVPVFVGVEDRLAPVALSRYVTRTFLAGTDSQTILANLVTLGATLGRPAVLVPTDDLAAELVAEHAILLSAWYLFPAVPAGLPRRLANKRDLYLLCTRLGIPSPETTIPCTAADARDYAGRARFPVVVKVTESQRVPRGARSVAIARTPGELYELYRIAESSGCGVVLQQYIPDEHAEDWIVHGYWNPHSGWHAAFTGRKLRSYPPFAGPTTLGVSDWNPALIAQTEPLLRATSYAGILDLDYRLDKRDGQYKLLDFNPRPGANFRLFEDERGVDVVRALHLDLTGRSVRRAPPVDGRKFVVEPYDLLASLGYMRHGRLTIDAWRRTLSGHKELAWLSWDDPAPFLGMCFRLLARAGARVARGRLRRPHSGPGVVTAGRRQSGGADIRRTRPPELIAVCKGGEIREIRPEQ